MAMPGCAASCGWQARPPSCNGPTVSATNSNATSRRTGTTRIFGARPSRPSRPGWRAPFTPGSNPANPVVPSSRRRARAEGPVCVRSPLCKSRGGSTSGDLLTKSPAGSAHRRFSLTMRPGLPQIRINAVSSRATRTPESLVSASEPLTATGPSDHGEDPGSCGCSRR